MVLRKWSCCWRRRYCTCASRKHTYGSGTAPEPLWPVEITIRLTGPIWNSWIHGGDVIVVCPWELSRISAILSRNWLFNSLIMFSGMTWIEKVDQLFPLFSYFFFVLFCFPRGFSSTVKGNVSPKQFAGYVQS